MRTDFDRMFVTECIDWMDCMLADSFIDEMVEAEGGSTWACSVYACETHGDCFSEGTDYHCGSWQLKEFEDYPPRKYCTPLSLCNHEY